MKISTLIYFLLLFMESIYRLSVYIFHCKKPLRNIKFRYGFFVFIALSFIYSLCFEFYLIFYLHRIFPTTIIWLLLQVIVNLWTIVFICKKKLEYVLDLDYVIENLTYSFYHAIAMIMPFVAIIFFLSSLSSQEFVKIETQIYFEEDKKIASLEKDYFIKIKQLDDKIFVLYNSKEDYNDICELNYIFTKDKNINFEFNSNYDNQIKIAHMKDVYENIWGKQQEQEYKLYTILLKEEKQVGIFKKENSEEEKNDFFYNLHCNYNV